VAPPILASGAPDPQIGVGRGQKIKIIRRPIKIIVIRPKYPVINFVEIAR